MEQHFVSKQRSPGLELEGPAEVGVQPSPLPPVRRGSPSGGARLELGGPGQAASQEPSAPSPGFPGPGRLRGGRGGREQGKAGGGLAQAQRPERPAKPRGRRPRKPTRGWGLGTTAATDWARPPGAAHWSRGGPGPPIQGDPARTPPPYAPRFGSHRSLPAAGPHDTTRPGPASPGPAPPAGRRVWGHPAARSPAPSRMAHAALQPRC